VGKNNLNRAVPAIGIIFIFIVSSIGPMISGINTISYGEDFSQDLDNLLFYGGSDSPLITESIIRDKYLHYIKYFDDSLNSKDEVYLEKTFLASSHYKVEEQLSQISSIGPMDSAWPMQG